MYAVSIPHLKHLALIVDDPRLDGCDAPVEKVEVQFPDDIENLDHLYEWPRGADAPMPRLGRDPSNQSRYRVFRSDRERQNAGFVSGALNFSVHGTWSDVARIVDANR